MTYLIWFLISSLLISCSVSDKCLQQDADIKRHFYVDERDLPIKIEMSSRISHQIVSNIMRILLNEVLGYPDVHLLKQHSATVGDNATRTLQKISSCKRPIERECKTVDDYGPEVMINLEVWLPPGFNLEEWIATGEVDDCGPLGPVGRSGWYVAEYTVNLFWQTNHTIIDHWKAFTMPEVVEHFDLFKDGSMKIYTKEKCTFEECGDDDIYRPEACRKSNVQCATLLADYPASNFELLKYTITRFELLVNVAWVGNNLESIIEKRTVANKSTLFFHKRPMFLSSHENFIHISFPKCEDVDTICEFEMNRLQKIIWSKIKANALYAYHVLKAMYFSQSDYLKLLELYSLKKLRGLGVKEVACDWIRENMLVWLKWTPTDFKSKSKLFIGGIFPINGIFWKQKGVIPAAHMAADAINKNDSLLLNYDLEILEQDGHCAADEVMKSYISYVTNATYKSMVGVLGPACSDTVEPIAGVAKNFKTVIISYSAEGALLRDKDKYSYFFRTIPENNQFRYVYLLLFEKLEYTRVAALTEQGQRYPEYISHLEELMPKRGMTFIMNRKFLRDRETLNMRPHLQALKSSGAKIIIGDFYDYAARAVMCEAYKLGMTAVNGYVWFLPLWFTSNWYDTDRLSNSENDDLGKVSCSTEQMVEAINGHMSLAYKYYADDDNIMQEGKTVREWLDRYKVVAEEQGLEVSRYGGYTYDAVWVYAMALDALLKENNSHVATLHSSRTSKRLLELLHKTNFSGVSGSLYFLGSSRISDIIIWQWLNHSVRQIGVYHPSSQSDGELKLNEKSIVWLTPNGKKPEDGSQEYSYCPVEPVRKLFKISCEVAVIIVNVFGLTVFGILVVAAAFWYKHRYESRMKLTEARMKELGLITSRVPFALDEWEIPRDHIVINRKLGEGAFGTVFGGEALVPNEGWKAVAVKTLKTGAKVEEKLDFLSEAEVMKQFDHMNIVKLIGVCTMGEPVYTVMEFMLYGDLKTYLLSRRNLVSEADRENSDEVSDRRLTNMALDIARGLSYLANLKYVHRDLACRNCLVNMYRSVKIADFGMCRPMFDSDYYRYNKKGMLPIRWMAPESLTDGLFTPMSDVWSYGVVLYEIITFASFPYQGLTNDQVLQHVKDHNTLPVPKGCKPELSNLLLQCWARSPHQRPQAAAIVEILARNPELISPCLDVPTASVEVEDTGTFELTIHDRSRVHSFSSVWQNRKTSVPFDRMQTELNDSSRTSLCAGENGNRRKHSGGKFSNRKTALHESFKKVKRDIYKDRGIELLPQVTYL